MKKRALLSAALALSLAALWTGVARAEDKEKEEDEQKVSINDVPEAVRATLKREAFGAEIKTVDMEKRDGNTVYEADAKIDGENYEILVSPKGKLISKKLDNEESEKASEKKESNEKKIKKDDDDDEKNEKK